MHLVMTADTQPNQIRLVIDPASPAPDVMSVFRLRSAQFTARVTLGVFAHVHFCPSISYMQMQRNETRNFCFSSVLPSIFFLSR